MKSLALSILLLTTSFAFSQIVNSEKGYVCTPCGYACDSAEYKSPGTCSSCGMAYVEKTSVRFENITFAEMCNRLKRNKNILLLDVRSPGEFTGSNTSIHTFGHLKKAININVTELPARLGELDSYKDKEIIVYCSHSHRSPSAAYLMTTNGYTKVANVLGGVSILEQQYGDNACLSERFVKHEPN